ncbi:conjugal transfer protein TrbF [Acidiphilium sp. PA]|uniref:conjugal transfer protein TrbF n=1 Tax=Acidiphilium sp. PA TaxID=2871705 RepID=UPI002244E432|nr:conjugal transfer protein TrbF [Acidiphilium sp. PA]MCW8309204.1 conjugal transfer protein TrbF [Acidiphilium sp. PA]
MRWRRISSRMSQTETPATPYQRAGQLWDQRIGYARVQAANWRLMAFGCLALATVVTIDDIRAHSRAMVTPFVVEVNHLGAVQAVAPAQAEVQPTDTEVAYFLAQFIERVRGLSVDPVVVRKAWLDAYAQITSHAKPMLDAYARRADPFGRIGKRAITVDVTSVVRASPSSFRVAWVEHPYQDGTALLPEHWTAILTVVIQTPHTEAALRQNPLGIYIDAISWAREVNSVQTEGSTP